MRANRYILAVREADTEGSATWESLVALKDELLAFEARDQHKSVSDITPTANKLNEYLEEERTLIVSPPDL